MYTFKCNCNLKKMYIYFSIAFHYNFLVLLLIKKPTIITSCKCLRICVSQKSTPSECFINFYFISFFVSEDLFSYAFHGSLLGEETKQKKTLIQRHFVLSRSFKIWIEIMMFLSGHKSTCYCKFLLLCSLLSVGWLYFWPLDVYLIVSFNI